MSKKDNKVEEKEIKESSKLEDIKSDESQENNLKEKIVALEKELAETKHNFLLARADYDNYRKRKELELIEIKEKAIINFVEDILPTIENFEMSLKMTNNQVMFIKGVEMIHKNLIEVLNSYHITSFEPLVGDSFNPHIHDAILIEDKTKKPNQVIEVLKKGYKHKDKVVKPAKVTIIKE